MTKPAMKGGFCSPPRPETLHYSMKVRFVSPVGDDGESSRSSDVGMATGPVEELAARPTRLG